MKCPKCESENTQRLEVVFHGGTQNISTTSNSAGVGIGSGGRIGFGGGVTKTSGQSQSVLAASCAPPAKKSLKRSGVIFLVGLLFVALPLSQSRLSFSQIYPQLFFGLAFITVGGYLSFKSYQFNTKEWPSLYQHWSESWLCHKCGGIYHQA